MWVEKRENGKYKFIERYEDYLTGQTKKVSITLDRNTPQAKKIARKALDAKIEQALNSCAVSDVTLKSLIDEYREDQKLTVKKATYTRNFHTCNSIMEILGKNTIVDRMTAKYVHDRFLASGKSAGTLNEYLARFRALIRWGYRNDILTTAAFLDKIEPFNDVPHKVKIQDKYLEADELRRLLSDMDETIWRLLTEFLALSGLRFGEAAALLKSDVDLKAECIHITKTYDSNNKVVTAPKSVCSIRDVYIQPELKDICRKINSEQLRRRLMFGLSSDLFLFSTNGGYINYFSYNKYLREHSEKSIGRKITAHALRHTHASLLMEKGVSIDTISRRLGHEDSKVTRDIYLHVTQKLKEQDDQQIAQVQIL